MKLALGTAQFGSHYGVTNTYGKPDESEACEIVRAASEAGFAFIDTAQAYGDAEAVVGRCLPAGQDHPQIVTKISPGATIGTIRASLDKLQRPSVYAILAHDPSDAESFAVLEGAMAKGLTERIGVSIYNAKQLQYALDRFTPDIVQLPISLGDLSNMPLIEYLNDKGIEIHIRSIFQQGALLAKLSLGHCLKFAMELPVDAVIVGVNRRSELQEIIHAVH